MSAVDASRGDVDPLFVALAQPLLRSPGGRPLLVVPQREQRIAAQPLPPALAARAPWCYGHSQCADPLPWLATHAHLYALLDGHRPLTIAPAQRWGYGGAALERPYPSVVCAGAGGLWFFFVNALPAARGQGPSVRVFAVDAAQAVECEPIADAQVNTAWAAAGVLWAAGLRPRRSHETHEEFGAALLLRFELRPFAPAGRWEGRDRVRVSNAVHAGAPDALQRVTGIEAWAATLPHADALGDGAAPWLVGSPLHRAHASDLSPLWMLGSPAPSDYADFVLARAPGGAALEPAPVIEQLCIDHSYVAQCRASALEHRVYVTTQGLQGLGRADVQHLRVLDWDASQGVLRSGPAMSIDGLASDALRSPLADLDVVFHPDFGYAASLAWLPASAAGQPAGVRTGALLHSADGVHWRLLQALDGV